MSIEADLVNVVRLCFKDGRIMHPTMVHKGADWQQDIQNAADYCRGYYFDQAIVEIITANSLLAAGIGNVVSIKEWPDYINEEFLAVETKTRDYLMTLRSAGRSWYLIGVQTSDLRYKENEQIFREKSAQRFVGNEQKTIKQALELALMAHRGQSQMRPQERLAGVTTLEHIPYSNHPIRVAMLAFDRGLSAEAVAAGLLHDVLEDTKIDEKYLIETAGPPESVVRLVKNLSRNKTTETREQFMKRINELTGEVVLLKCFDRLHNLIRSFCLPDPQYLSRYIKESKEVYLPKFTKYPELRDLSTDFGELLRLLEIERESFL